MTKAGVQLVVHIRVFPTYTVAQQARMLNVDGFIGLVRGRQG